MPLDAEMPWTVVSVFWRGSIVTVGLIGTAKRGGANGGSSLSGPGCRGSTRIWQRKGPRPVIHYAIVANCTKQTAPQASRIIVTISATGAPDGKSAKHELPL